MDGHRRAGERAVHPHQLNLLGWSDGYLTLPKFALYWILSPGCRSAIEQVASSKGSCTDVFGLGCAGPDRRGPPCTAPKQPSCKADRDLFVLKANERSMTHKFAEYLQRDFEGWDVDCEYNRCGDVPKRLQWMIDEHVPPVGKDPAVLPDIIVHRRRTTENLLVIEAKKSGSKNDQDRLKLEAFMSDPRFRYAHAVLLGFVFDEPYDITIEPVERPRDGGEADLPV